MYTLINQNITGILSQINAKGDVGMYETLLAELRESDVTANEEFQRIYRNYWRLGAARLGADFCRAYFLLLERLKQTSDFTVEKVAHKLLMTPTHGDGRKTLQFSFASKLVHMLCPERPVFDSMVAAFYFLPTNGAGKTPEEKLQQLLESYRFLESEYARVLREGILADSIEQFRKRFKVRPTYTDQKVIDTLIWKFVTMLRNGAVRKGDVVYR